MDDFRKDFETIKRETVDTRAAVIRVENQIRASIGELKRVVQVNEGLRSTNRYLSVSAMLVLAVVLTAAGVALSEYRAEALNEKIDHAERKRDALQEENRALLLTLEKHDAADLRAMQVVQLIESDDPAGAIREFDKLTQSELPRATARLLAPRVDELRAMLARKHYEEGLKQYNIGGLRSAVQEFDKSLAYRQDTDFKPDLLYHRGQAFHALKEYAKAAADLQAAAQGDPRPKVAPHADLLAGLAMEEGGKLVEAVAYYQQVLARHPMHPWRQTLRYRISLVKPQLNPPAPSAPPTAPPVAPAEETPVE